MKRFLSITFFIIIGFTAFSQDSLNAVDLKEIVFTGQFEPQSLKQSVYQVRMINAEVINRRSATNVQSVLNTELGIRFANDLTLGISDIAMMGMSGQNVKILLDGVPLLDRGATKESLNQIDVRTIERIEIVEGPMSVVYGSDALAGVINIITKKGVDDGHKFSVNAFMQEETAGEEYSPLSGKGMHNKSISTNWLFGKWNASAGLTRNTSGGWREGREDASTEFEWHPKDQWLGSATVGFTKNKFNIWYRLNYLNEGILSKEGSFTDQATQTLMVVDREYITNRYTHQAQSAYKANEKWNFNAVISYQDYTRRTMTTSVNTKTGDRRLYVNEAGSQAESRFQSEVVRLIAVHKFSQQVSLQTGVDVNLNKGMGDRIEGTQSINDYALFASTEFAPTKRLNIRPGLRFMHNSVYEAPPVIPSVNAKLVLSEKLDLRLAYAYGFRAPALRELYFSFHDANHSIDGNKNLKAENSNSFSASLVAEAYRNGRNRVTSTLGTSYNLFQNMISLGSIDPENPNLFTYVNIYRNKTTGFTLNNNFVTKNIIGQVGLSYIANYNQLSENEDSLPSLLWTPEINGSISYYFEKPGASLSAFYKFNGPRSNYTTAVVDNEEVVRLGKIGSYHWTDVTASKKITKLLELNAGVKNIFNVTQVNNTVITGGSAHSSGGPMPVGYGRSYFLSLNFEFVK
jgi:outer membrane receptor for ferrienterochelin and colicins